MSWIENEKPLGYRRKLGQNSTPSENEFKIMNSMEVDAGSALTEIINLSMKFIKYDIRKFY